jgi:TIR domain/Carboxypeptidase regulatory-like domain
MSAAEVPSPKEKPSKTKYNIRWRWIIAGICLLLFGLLLTPVARFYFVNAQSGFLSSVKHPAEVSSDKSKPQSKNQVKSSDGFPAASVAMQTRVVFPEATPTPADGEKKEKNVFRKILDWFVGLFRKKKPTTVSDEPANVTSIKLDKSDVIIACPVGFRPRNAGADCPDDMSVKVSTSAVNPNPNGELVYSYTVSGGRIVGTGANVVWDLSGVAAGTYNITAAADNGAGFGATKTETISVGSCDCELEPLSPTPTPGSDCDCPTLRSETTSNWEDILFEVQGGGNNLRYKWTVTNGDIVDSNNTNIILAKRKHGDRMKATVEIDGIDSRCNCSKSLSATVFFFGDIYGVIRDKNKNPRANVKVTLQGSGGRIFEVVTNANGEYRIDSVPYGSYTITVEVDGVARTMPVTVNEASHTVNFDFSPPSPSPSPLPVTPTDEPTPSASPTPEESPTATPTPTPTATPDGKTTKYDKIELKYPQRVLPEIEHEINFSLEHTDFPIEPTNQTIPVNISINPFGEPSANTNVSVNRIVHTATVVSVTEKCKDCMVYARPRLIITKGLVVTEEPYSPERIYNGNRQAWTWKVKTTLKEGEEAAFKIQLDYELRSETEKQILSDYWKDSREILVPVGLPGWITILAPASGGAGMLGIVGGAVPRRRRREEEEEDAEEPAGDAVSGEAAGDEVSATIYAPPQAKVGSNFLVQVFAHLPEHAEEIKKAVAAQNQSAVEQDATVLDEKVERGSRLTFALQMLGMQVDEPVQVHKWKGDALEVSYIVLVPKDFPPGESFGKVIISLDGIPIGRLHFKTEIVSAATEVAATKPTAGQMTFYKTAFISYASKDRPEVLKRVQMLKAQNIPFFQDMISLNPGDRWAKELYKNIDNCDVLYLFWSEAAKESEWVQKEVLYAYELSKDDAMPDIIPIPIEGPPPVKPPDELNFLHFNDEFIYLIYASEAEKKIKEE